MNYHLVYFGWFFVHFFFRHIFLVRCNYSCFENPECHNEFHAGVRGDCAEGSFSLGFLLFLCFLFFFGKMSMEAAMIPARKRGR